MEARERASGARLLEYMCEYRSNRSSPRDDRVCIIQSGSVNVWYLVSVLLSVISAAAFCGFDLSPGFEASRPKSIGHVEAA